MSIEELNIWNKILDNNEILEEIKFIKLNFKEEVSKNIEDIKTYNYVEIKDNIKNINWYIKIIYDDENNHFIEWNIQNWILRLNWFWKKWENNIISEWFFENNNLKFWKKIVYDKENKIKILDCQIWEFRNWMPEWFLKINWEICFFEEFKKINFPEKLFNKEELKELELFFKKIEYKIINDNDFEKIKLLKEKILDFSKNTEFFEKYFPNLEKTWFSLENSKELIEKFWKNIFEKHLLLNILWDIRYNFSENLILERFNEIKNQEKFLASKNDFRNLKIIYLNDFTPEFLEKLFKEKPLEVEKIFNFYYWNNGKSDLNFLTDLEYTSLWRVFWDWHFNSFYWLDNVYSASSKIMDLALQSAVKKFPKYDWKVFRGIRFNTKEELNNFIKNFNNSLWSTVQNFSTIESVSKLFSTWENSILIEVLPNNKIHYSNLEWDTEKHAWFEFWTKFKLESINYNLNPIKIILSVEN